MKLWNQITQIADDIPLLYAVKWKLKALFTPAHELEFQEAMKKLVMKHIDRMGDICEEDTAENIIHSMEDGFQLPFKRHLSRKFPVTYGEFRGMDSATFHAKVILPMHRHRERLREMQIFHERFHGPVLPPRIRALRGFKSPRPQLRSQRTGKLPIGVPENDVSA